MFGLSNGSSLHEAWREKADIRDPSKFPVVVAGPQVFERCLLKCGTNAIIDFDSKTHTKKQRT